MKTKPRQRIRFHRQQLWRPVALVGTFKVRRPYAVRGIYDGTIKTKTFYLTDAEFLRAEHRLSAYDRYCLVTDARPAAVLKSKSHD